MSFLSPTGQGNPTTTTAEFSEMPLQPESKLSLPRRQTSNPIPQAQSSIKPLRDFILGISWSLFMLENTYTDVYWNTAKAPTGL